MNMTFILKVKTIKNLFIFIFIIDGAILIGHHRNLLGQRPNTENSKELKKLRKWWVELPCGLTSKAQINFFVKNNEKWEERDEFFLFFTVGPHCKPMSPILIENSFSS